MEPLKEKLNSYRNTSAAKEWLEENLERVKALFSDVRLRDFVFEPFRGVFDIPGTFKEAKIKQVITLVAVTNMVLAGLPGKMGVGVAVSMALEAWMAFTIAKSVGIKLRSVSDIWKYFGLLAGTVVTILYLFRSLLGLSYSAFSVVPGINPIILAELFTTNLVGVLFWIGFEEAREQGSFTIPARMAKRAWQETRALFDFQFDVIKGALSVTNLKRIGSRLKAWLSGDIVLDEARLRGDLFVTAALMYLQLGEFDRLNGPMGQEFIGAIRDRYPGLANASHEEIAEHFARYDTEQMLGVTNLIKGKLFERLVARQENADGDEWRAVLHDDESYPGSDIIMVNEQTGEILELSIKASPNHYYLEESLSRYPEFPILTVSDHAERYADDPMIHAFDMSNQDLEQVTAENFDYLLTRLNTVDAAQMVGSGVALGAAASLWPFTVAYLRKRITQEQLEVAYRKVLGEAGVALAARVSYALLLGPVFAWYLLARGVMAGMNAVQSEGLAPSCAPRRAMVSVERQHLEQNTASA